MNGHQVEHQQGRHPQQQVHQNQRHYNRNNDEEKFGKLKFSMPKFKGEEDADAYLDWELKVEKIFRIHNYAEDKKVAMASLELEL